MTVGVVSQFTRMALQAACDVPLELARTAASDPVPVGVTAIGLAASIRLWDGFKPRLAEGLVACRQRFAASPASTAPTEEATRWQAARWQRGIPSLGVLLMGGSFLHSLNEMRAVGGAWDTEEFRRPFGLALVTGFFLATVLGMDILAGRLEQGLKMPFGRPHGAGANTRFAPTGMTETTGPALSKIKLAQRTRLIQTFATYLCLVDDIVPLMVLLRAVFY